MARFLMEECGANLQHDRFGLLPIHDAVRSGHAELTKYLQSKELLDVPAEMLPTGRSTLERSIQPCEKLMRDVFENIVKEGAFSYNTVSTEVHHFFRGLGLHPVYFEHFTPGQIAKHIHCLMSAKRVARATDAVSRMGFAFPSEDAGFFLSTYGCPTPTEAQLRTEEKVSAYLTESFSGTRAVGMIFMASDAPVFPGGQERLGIYEVHRGPYAAAKVSESETSLQALASVRFLKEKTEPAKQQYQLVINEVVASRRSVIRMVPGSVYPGPYPGGVVLLFGTAETAGRHYFRAICQALRLCHLSPKRFYMESFLNGAIVYSLFFPSAKEEEVEKLSRTITYCTLLKTFPGRSEVVYNSVMGAQIPFEVGLYLLVAVKFVYAFFPKEQYAPEYTHVQKILDKDPVSQRKLESLYKLCMKELLTMERIYDLVQRHLSLAVRFFNDFRDIALGHTQPRFSDQLSTAINEACQDEQDRQILRMFLTFNASILLTNFFKANTPGAFSFRLDPAVVFRNRPTSLYPEVPYGIYLVSGRDFFGFHVRFRDVARGGIRLVLSRDQASYDRNHATLFEECYNLALTQQYKNKDIPEGGAKGVILPDSSWPNAGSGNVLAGSSSQSPAAARSCFTKYLEALLDCMMPEQNGIYSGHMKGSSELLYFGPDENTAGFMDLGAELARARGYPYWKALTTGKSVRLGGVPHDTYGMTTASVHAYVLELLRELGEEEAAITKFQTGGPDGDLGSNEILVSKDRTIGMVDGSGVLYDPAGLNREELVRLARKRAPVREFERSLLGVGGFLVTVDEADVVLPDGSKWSHGVQLRDRFHLTDYATADLFVPCGGRPNAVTEDSVKSLLRADGRPKFRMIVEGANLFMSPGARLVLEKAGVHVFRDASTNKGGVNSSSLEVFAALALPPADHAALMTYSPEAGGEPPKFYNTYVQQILDTIVENARLEFRAIWSCNARDGTSKVELTQQLSRKINLMQDTIQGNLQVMSPEERDQLVRRVLAKAVPPLMVERLGVEGILRQVPQNYIGAMVGAWLASRFVYKHGNSASEVAFFLFLRSLLQDEPTESESRKRAAPAADSDHDGSPAARSRVG